MIPVLKSELRKILTVRSSYIIPLVAYGLLFFLLFYVVGFSNGPDNTQGPGGNLFLANSITYTSSILSIFGAIIALLLVTHEYRYNTIMYSLTIANRRSKVLIGKMVAIVIYIFAYVLLGVSIALCSLVVGTHLSGALMPSQDLSLTNYFVETLVFCEAWALSGLLFAVLIRNQVAAVAVLLIVPNTAEGLIGLLLKDNAKYLPFAALSHVVAPPVGTHVSLESIGVSPAWTPLQATGIFLMYLTIGWVIGWVLFLRRDAS